MSEAGQHEWEIYEQVAGQLLAKLSTALGLELERVEGKQALPGKSGTTWEIDRVGITKGGGKVVAIECRRYPEDTIKQQAIAAMAYTMRDVGAKGGIIVTPKGVQSGGQKVADYEGIVIVLLDADATATDFLLKTMDKLIAGRSATFSGRGILSATAVGYEGTAPPTEDADR
jgi:hypothetical protein